MPIDALRWDLPPKRATGRKSMHTRFCLYRRSPPNIHPPCGQGFQRQSRMGKARKDPIGCMSGLGYSKPTRFPVTAEIAAKHTVAAGRIGASHFAQGEGVETVVPLRNNRMVQKIMTATLANRDIWRETHTCIQKRGVALAIRYADAASLASAVQIRCIAIWSAFRMMTLCMEQAAPPCVFCCASVPVERAPAYRALPSKPGPKALCICQFRFHPCPSRPRRFTFCSTSIL